MAKTALPRPADYILKEPLYTPLVYDGDEVWRILDIIYYTGTYDAICLECKGIATFQAGSPPRPQEFIGNEQRELLMKREGVTVNLPSIGTSLHVVTGQCTRDKYHDLQQFIFWTGYRRMRTADGKSISETVIEKVGQYPSFADMILPEARKYRPILDQQRLAEFNKAIGLAAHGVGVGSYVYLRRIFESLIEEAHTVAITETAWDEDAYKNGRMADKINLLKKHLPDFLVKHPGIYSLLSKGIHELAERECLEHFNTLRDGIELILGARLAAMEVVRQEQKTSADLSKAIGANHAQAAASPPTKSES